ncbi:hypothetical protein GCM10010207_64760 [Streptomyces atratus]|nr:hypothetical protein GCM10010207_64760 [Streptomyces atratus]
MKVPVIGPSGFGDAVSEPCGPSQCLAIRGGSTTTGPACACGQAQAGPGRAGKRSAYDENTVSSSPPLRRGPAKPGGGAQKPGGRRNPPITSARHRTNWTAVRSCR